MTVRTARCACGACQVEVEGEPVSSGLCSCDNCKRRTGAPFGWSVYFRDGQVRKVEGPLTVLEGMGQRWFCATCGSTLYWKSFGAWRPGQTGFAGGCFADPTLPSPTIAVRCAQGMPWTGYPLVAPCLTTCPRALQRQWCEGQRVAVRLQIAPAIVLHRLLRMSDSWHEANDRLWRRAALPADAWISRE
jgi:hypothetical protein